MLYQIVIILYSNLVFKQMVYKVIHYLLTMLKIHMEILQKGKLINNLYNSNIKKIKVLLNP